MLWVLSEAFLMSTQNIFFMERNKNICCEYSIETPRRGNSNEYPQHIFFMENYVVEAILMSTHNMFLWRTMLFMRF